MSEFWCDFWCDFCCSYGDRRDHAADCAYEENRRLHKALDAAKTWLRADDAWNEYENTSGVKYGFDSMTFETLSELRQETREEFRAALGKVEK